MQAPLPTVGPSSVTQESQQIRVSADAFGVGFGEAIQGAGRAVSHLSDVVYENTIKAQNVINENTARDTTVAAEVAAGEKQAEFNAKQGMDSVNSRAAYVADITKIRDDAIASAKGNPAVEKMLRDQLARTTGNAIVSSASRSASELKNATNASATAAVTQATNQAATYANDPVAFEGYLNDIRKNTDVVSDNMGSLPAARQLAGDTAVSKAITFSIANTALTEPEKAKALLDKYGKQIQPADLDNATRAVDQGLVSKTSRVVAEDVAQAAQGSGSLKARIRMRESGGDDNAKNPLSSASGRYQFTDGTWRQLAQDHPGLGLNSGNKNDPAAQERAMDQLVADNSAALQKRGVPVNDKNLYLAHFMGAGGASVFYHAMTSDPTQGAASAFPKQAKANPTIFYNQDGSEKTIAQVYQGLTGKFGAPLTAEEQVALGKQRASQLAPGNQNLADAVETHVIQNVNQQRAVDTQAYQTKQNSVIDAVVGGGDYKNQPHSLADIQANPALFQAYSELNGKDQSTIMNMIKSQNTAYDQRPPTKEQDDFVKTVKGQSILAPESVANLSPADYASLPSKERNLVSTMVRSAQATVAKQGLPPKEKDAPSAMISGLLAGNQEAFGAAFPVTGSTINPNAPFDRNDPAYPRFVGAMQDYYDDFRLAHDGKSPTQEDMNKQAATLLRRTHEENSGGLFNQAAQIFGKGVPTVKAGPYEFQEYVPDSARSKIVAWFVGQGVRPTPAMIYNKYRAFRNDTSRPVHDDAPGEPPVDEAPATSEESEGGFLGDSE